MLVCRDCGREIRVAGHPCGDCGSRSAIEARFFQGEVKPLAEDAPATDISTHHASQAGTLPDAQRAWSPWLAAALSLVFGPAGAGLFAARNLVRLRGRGPDPWGVAALLLVGQLLVGCLAGFVARTQVTLAWSLFSLYSLAVAGGLVRWQWDAVARQRRELSGRHIPGADAFGVFLMAIVLGLVGFLATSRVAGAISDGAFIAPLQELVPDKQPAAPDMNQFQMPPM